MSPLITDQSRRKATFGFYDGVLAVVYGLLVSKGLENSVTFLKEEGRENVGFPLYLGTFLMSLHFWFVCSGVEDLSEDFYQILAGPKTPLFNLLILFDVMVATLFALFVLGMFNTIPDQQFFVWFLVAGGLSLAYDLICGGLVWLAKNERHERLALNSLDLNGVEKYKAQINSWIKTDSVFVGVATVMWYWRNDVIASLTLTSLFAMFTAVLLLMDVGLFQELPTYFSSNRKR